jgi:transcriptional regulator NrdR family protein
MKCPICAKSLKSAKDLHVAETRAARRDGESFVVQKRVRRCDNNHSFSFTERYDDWTLENITIRQSGHGKGRFHASPFDLERLRKDISAGVVGLLSDAEVREVARGVVEQLHDEMSKRVNPVTGKELDEISAPEGGLPTAFIWDFDVQEVVENQLVLSKYRVPHVLYATTFHGRVVGERKGWVRAEDVLGWLFSQEAYNDLKQPLPERKRVFEDRWRPLDPREGAPPLDVIKAGRIIATTPEGDRTTPEVLETVAGRLVRFNPKRFVESIQLALLGRPTRNETARNVAWWVLTELSGQQRVHSSQLSVGVLDCLRRVDDIAYLRWATHVKTFPQVRNFVTEAIGLIEHPSDRLVFESIQPMPRRHVARTTDAP